ncbi:putative membrane-associated kinase regulator 2 [Apostasia shenzhenica]|uniref:Putative membrane-associated kinase regulator 2 n=1 Tax=Apostasia shenzhenica TaxID=1088818 RepID=A0A2I0AU25_9ASPA|nr:putative membrane-associated kinase regulator 2 [Apostasia shenzhenica]
MEFRMLRFWRGAVRAATANNLPANEAFDSPQAPPVAAEMDDAGGDDEGPFFDLEFAVADGEEDDDSEEREEEKDSSHCLPSSDDLFFNGRLVPLEKNSIVTATAESDFKPQLAISLLKSATRLRVFMLGLRKPKSTVSDSVAAATAAAGASLNKSKFFVKFEVEEIPIVSGNHRNSCDSAKSDPEDSGAPAPEEKKTAISKEIVQKYLGKIMPLYLKVSKIYSEKLRFSGQLVPSGAPGETETETTAAVASAPETGTGEKSLKPAMPSTLRVVYKRLGKSKSSSVAVPSSAPPAVLPLQRQDDSLLQQEDGIQSAIAHCKRSFFASASEGEEPRTLKSLPFISFLNF